MATPKFDRIADRFVKRIGDRFKSAFTIGAAMPDAEILDAVDIEAYVNTGLHNMVDKVWMGASGQPQAFAAMLPEMVSTPKSIAFTSGVYTPATPNLDFFKIYSAYGSSKIIRIWDEDAFSMVQAGEYPEHPPTEDSPVIIQLAGNLYIFPATEASATILYLKKPLVSTDGSYLTQNGSVDSPFEEFRSNALAELAANIYWEDKKKGA